MDYGLKEVDCVETPQIPILGPTKQHTGAHYSRVHGFSVTWDSQTFHSKAGRYELRKFLLTKEAGYVQSV